MKRNWKVIAPLALSAAGALAAGLVVLLGKNDQDAPAAAAPAKKAAPEKALCVGSYSFISGFKDAAPVEMSLSYDPEKFSFTVVEEDFLSYSSDSHVAIVYGEDFNLQIEYAGFYADEDFAARCAALAEKHADLAEVSYGDLKGVSYLDGDNMALCLAIPGDAHSFLLVTVQKTSAYDDAVTTLPAHPELRALLESVSFTRS